MSQQVAERFRDVLSSLSIERYTAGPLQVLELGTLRWGAASTHHASWLPPGTEHVMSDMTDGDDVDVVADAHDLAPFADASFDAVIACSVWEHLERPWVAADAVARVLRPGGVAYIATHQSFPLHGYPSDYFRFSTEAMAVLFGAPLFDRHETGYSHPAKLVPPPEVKVWDPSAPVWLNVAIMTRRAG